MAWENCPVLLRGLKIAMPSAAKATAPRLKLSVSVMGDAAGTGTSGIRQ